MAFSLEDYVDVAERLRLFYEKYPDGRIVTSHVTYKEWGPITGMFATAEAYRTADDPHPAVGTAWEPVPGKTQFTRDSEVQNAETAAWGRAIVAAGIGTKRIASLEEVRNRGAEDSKSPREVSRSPARVAKPAAQPTASAPATPPADERSPRPPVPPDQGAGRAASKPYPLTRGSAAPAGDEHSGRSDADQPPGVTQQGLGAATPAQRSAGRPEDILSTNDLKLPPSARKVITAAQRKKLFALARGYNMSDPTIRTIVEAITGSRSTAEIQRKDFDVLLERIELEGRGAEA